MDTFCDRDFAQHAAGAAEKYDGTDRPLLPLRGYPVIGAPVSVTVGGALLAATDYRVRPGMAGAPNAGILERRSGVWPKGWENVAVVYSWGYATPPDAVRRVVEDLVVTALLNAARSYKGKGMQTVGIDGFTAGLQRDAEGLTDAHRSELQAYRRVVVA